MRVLLSLLLTLSQLTVFVETAEAITSPGGVVISQVQAGDVSEKRFVELYNNTDEPVDITGWCLRYVSDTASLSYGGTTSMRACFTSGSSIQHLVLSARSYILIASSQLGISSDYVLSSGLGSGPSGKVYLVNTQKETIDLFGWGSATTNAEGNPKAYISDATVYERIQSSPGVYSDTNNNGDDFFYSTPRAAYSMGSIAEVEDVCQNIPEIQVLVPEGMVLIDDWQCLQEQFDLCNNIEGEQLVLAPGMEIDGDNNCFQDACLNLPGFQNAVPAGFQIDIQNLTCSLGILPILVTELLPNPDGDDKNNEFIELYNPNSVAVDLTYHVFHLSGDYTKAYGFPAGLTIEPQSYLAVYNKDMTFTLTNTLSSLRLRSLDSIHVVDVPEYSNAKSGEAWALINDTWQYTNMPTPGAENIPSSIEQELMTAVFLTDCGEGRERNPLTKRCRNVVVAKSSVKPCKDGQYRSEETNRCRNITAVNAKPCKDNQYRSEETGRCRNLSATSVPPAGFAVQPIKESGMAFIGWWVLGGVVLLVGAYGAWEWRREVSNFFARLLKRI